MLKTGPLSSSELIMISLALPEPNDEVAYIGLTTPDSHYIEGETLQLQFLPAKPGYFEVKIKEAARGKNKLSLRQENHWLLVEDLVSGSYSIQGRWVKPLSGDRVCRWSGWSDATKLTYHPAEKLNEVQALRIYEHRLALMSERDLAGVITITDPWAIPPGCPEDQPVRWFRAPCYEGSAGMLLNEEADYYRDPLAYYLSCLQQLQEQGVIFLTWHDLLEGKFGRAEWEALIQFDVDGGPLSMERIYPELHRLGIRANIMIHRQCYDWYTYQIEDLNIEYLQQAERNGWTIGYHNNSINNTQRLTRLGDYSPEILQMAAERFEKDVHELRQWFNIRTFTHHGGNVFNKYTPVPDTLDIVCVDRAFNKPLWQSIRSAFSDGGFMSRPCSLRQKINTLTPGLHFFRSHPAKYGNYTPPFDIPPLDIQDAVKAGCEPTEILVNQVKQGIEKQSLWLKLRDQHRLTRRLSYASLDKPLSRHFRPFSEIQDLAQKFRSRRRPQFLREYPWLMGDPRVFWWRLLHTYAPAKGEVLNVGALPPEQRDETTEFLSKKTTVLEMDIDPKREPHILGDITDPPSGLEYRFAGVFLFGLPYIHSPGKAIEVCARLTAPGGVGLFGFSADTHPLRGALWRPETRPIWRRDKEPLQNMGLRGNLWSFDQAGLLDLFSPWDEVMIEFFNHYWFAVCHRKAYE